MIEYHSITSISLYFIRTPFSINHKTMFIGCQHSPCWGSNMRYLEWDSDVWCESIISSKYLVCSYCYVTDSVINIRLGTSWRKVPLCTTCKKLKYMDWKEYSSWGSLFKTLHGHGSIYRKRQGGKDCRQTWPIKI